MFEIGLDDGKPYAYVVCCFFYDAKGGKKKEENSAEL